MAFDPVAARKSINDDWTKEGGAIDQLKTYIGVKNISPEYTGYTRDTALEAANLLLAWVKGLNLPNTTAAIHEDILSAEIVGESAPVITYRTPIILVEIAATKPSGAVDVFLYGHFDKQPPMDGWVAPSGGDAYTPAIADGKLYGRGGADDGYSVFSALTAIKALKDQKIPHDRYVVLIEGSEESGSPDLDHYVTKHAATIGNPALIVCLDSGSGDYDRLWLTTSLRGLVSGILKIQLLVKGQHSGSAGGIAASTFRVQRIILDRLQDPLTEEVKVPEFIQEISKEVRDAAEAQAKIVGDSIWKDLGFLEGARPTSDSNAELILNKAWRPTLSIVGASGLPEAQGAGNVLREFTTLNLSMRVPPDVDPAKALAALTKLVTENPPYGATITFDAGEPAKGFSSPPIASWLHDSLHAASKEFFGGNEYLTHGEGGSIPFMGMLKDKFPQAQFVITGVLGPQSSAHSSNEFLHLEYAQKITGAIASILYTLATKK